MHIHTKLKKSDGKLIGATLKENVNFQNFIESLPNNSLVDCYFEVINTDGSLAQLAKIHKDIRILSNELGYSFSDMKLLIKEKTGLCILRTIEGKEYLNCKSFADCSKQELNEVIITCEHLARDHNINLDGNFYRSPFTNMSS